MVFSNNAISQPLIPIFINNNLIDYVTKYNLLGLHLDPSLSWQLHIDHIVSKLGACFFALNRTKFILNETYLKLILNSLGISHMNYCSTIFSNATQSSLNKITVKFNECCRSILGLNSYSSGTATRLHLGYMHPSDLYEFNKTVFMFDAINNCLPTYISNLLIEPCHSHNTRFRTGGNVSTQFFKSNTGQKSFSYWGPSVWAKVNLSLKLITNRNTFKHHLKNKFIAIQNSH